MKKILPVFLFALLAPAVAADKAPTPDSFARRADITLNGAGPYHRVPLPLAVYQEAKRADLGDLRVFNQSGEILPYALWREEGKATKKAQEVQAAFFPLPALGAGEGPGEVEVSVRRNGDGTLVAVRQGNGTHAPAGGVRGVVIDAGKLRGAVSLRLGATGGQQPFHAFTLESSDDLQHWQLLKGDAVFVHLTHEGRQLDSNLTDWSRPAGRYLRLLWQDAAQAPTVRSVTLGRVDSESVPAQRLWSAPLAPVASGEGYFEYQLPGQLPLEQLRINLPQVNLLLPFELQRESCGYYTHRHGQRPQQECGWQTVMQDVAYRLQAGQGEAKSGDQNLSATIIGGRLRLRFDPRSGSIGKEVPTLQAGFVPQELVFLARGAAPYSLAWSSADVAPANLPLSTLLPGYRVGDQPPGSFASVQAMAPARQAAGATAPKEPVATHDQSKWLLWSVLGVGLLALGLMSRSLLAQLEQAKATK
jgi:hypothetical protein